MDVQQITKITLAWELFEQGVPQTHIAKQIQVNRDTVRLWLNGIKEYGLQVYLDKYINAKKGKRVKRQVDPILKRWVWEIRERELECCGQKIAYFLEKEHKVSISVPKIYEILAEKYVIRSKWKKNQKRGCVPKAMKPREAIQMDTVDFGEVFAFTGVDIYTREVDVLITPSLTSHDGLVFLNTSMQRRFGGFSELIQTDGGPEFKDEFKKNVYTYTKRHRVSRPYKKNEQSYIESFNRTLRKECLGWIKYKVTQVNDLNSIVEKYLERYHYHRPHLGLGLKTPLER